MFEGVTSVRPFFDPCWRETVRMRSDLDQLFETNGPWTLWNKGQRQAEKIFPNGLAHQVQANCVCGYTHRAREHFAVNISLVDRIVAGERREKSPIAQGYFVLVESRQNPVIIARTTAHDLQRIIARNRHLIREGDYGYYMWFDDNFCPVEPGRGQTII